MVVHVLLERCLRSALLTSNTLRLFLPHSMYSGPRIHIIVDRPVRALATIRQWARDLLEAWIEGKIVSNGVLKGADEGRILTAIMSETHLPSRRCRSEVRKL